MDNTNLLKSRKIKNAAYSFPKSNGKVEIYLASSLDIPRQSDVKYIIVTYSKSRDVDIIVEELVVTFIKPDKYTLIYCDIDTYNKSPKTELLSKSFKLDGFEPSTIADIAWKIVQLNSFSCSIGPSDCV